MKLSLQEWQYLVAILREKDLELSRHKRELFAADPKIEGKWDLYSDVGEYEDDATEEEKVNISRYDNLRYEESTLADLRKKIIWGEAEL